VIAGDEPYLFFASRVDDLIMNGDWLGLGTRGMGLWLLWFLFNDRVKLASIRHLDRYQPGLLLKGSQ